MQHNLVSGALWFLLTLLASAVRAETFADLVAARLAAGEHTLLSRPDFSRDVPTIRELYARKGARQDFAPIWFAGRELTRQGVLLLQTLRAADDYGLRPGDYDGTPLVYHVIDFITNRSAPESELADLDIGMSIAAARFLRHLHFGRIDPRNVGFNLDAPRAEFDLAGAILKAADAEDFAHAVADAEPHFLHYRLVKDMLKIYRLLAVDRELTELPSFKARSIKLNDAYVGTAKLHRLLVELGDLPADAHTSQTRLDATLSAAVQRFQRRHGLAADGMLGRKTFAALTTPLSVRAEQLALTLERWRWLPEFASPPIIVNIPQFRLFAFRSTEDRAAEILQMDVIVGKTSPPTQTPIFMADAKYVVFRPYWDVPDSILHNELLPEIRAKPEYFAKNDFEIVSSTDPNAPSVEPSAEAIDQLEQGALRLRQRPGPDNALGLVKLMLPNPHNVYLHSTPAKHLFNESRRTFSHGCIRVSDPVGLIAHALRGAGGDWTPERVEAVMNDETPEGQNRHVFLSKPIPVLVVYGTAIVLESGEVQFFEDIYGHDAKLKELLR